MLFRPFISIPTLSLRKRAKESVQVFVVDTFSDPKTNPIGHIQSKPTLSRHFNKVYGGILFINTYQDAMRHLEQTVFEAKHYINDYCIPGHDIPLYITLSEAIIPEDSSYYLGNDNGLGMTEMLLHGHPLYEVACRDIKTVL